MTGLQHHAPHFMQHPITDTAWCQCGCSECHGHVEGQEIYDCTCEKCGCHSDAENPLDEDSSAAAGWPCSRHCGYYSHGQDLIDHERHEHALCPECGAGLDDYQDEEYLRTYCLDHRPGCPRLQPGYEYPAGGPA